MSRWQDNYHVGDRVDVLVCGEWLPAVVTRKTRTGQPEVRTETKNPLLLGNGQLRKNDLRSRMMRRTKFALVIETSQRTLTDAEVAQLADELRDRAMSSAKHFLGGAGPLSVTIKVQS